MIISSKIDNYYCGTAYRIFGTEILTIWVIDYRKSTVVKNIKICIDVYTRYLSRNMRVITIKK